AAVARRSIWANRSSRPYVSPRAVSLRVATSANTRPKPKSTASETTPSPGWPPSQLATNTPTPSARLNSGMNHFERIRASHLPRRGAGLGSLVIEPLLDRDAEVAGQRHRQPQCRRVPVVLDRVDRLPRHSHGLCQLALGQPPPGTQLPHLVLHRCQS